LGARLFTTPPARRRESQAEVRVLAEGRQVDLAFEGGRLRTWRWGESGPLVVLAHGWGGSAGQLRAFVHPLVDAGYTVAAFDAPGHGRSSGARSSLPGFAAALMHVAHALGPVHAVVAHSMGGAAAALAVSRGLQVERLVLLAPPADARVWLGKFTRAVGLGAEAAGRVRARIEQELAVGFDDLEVGAYGSAVTAPLLVVHDRTDAEVPWEDGARTADAGADARMHTTFGLGHRGILRDAEVLREVVRFVAAADAGNARTSVERELFERPRRWDRLAGRAARAA
jgi:pimeloyl-ACP methyl ester carboxylesterase